MSEKKPKTLAEQSASAPSDRKYDGKASGAPMPEEQSKQIENLEKMKKKLEEFKKAVLKKYNFTISLGLIPVNASPLLEEDEALPKEVVESKPLHIIMIIPEDNYKDLSKIKPEVVKMAKETKENLWVHIKTPVDIWNYGLDSKFEFVDALSASLPIHDNGFLGALRVANIHKSLLLRKFEKYVTSYVIGGSLVRGTAGKDSDVDVFVVIDDTDVKRMTRLELLDKLKGIVYDYIKEATAIAGVKNILSPQVWLLTDFWQSVRDVNPVIFTFIRDGIPLYDRGTFLPWKLLLKMGKIKPSPEAIEIYMKESERTEELVKRRMLDAMIDIYYGIVTPTQAMMMLYGMAPPTHKESPKVFKEIFFDKEKMVDKRYVEILEKIVNNFRQYEYGKLKEISGSEIDKLRKDGQDYNKMLQKLRGKIEKKLHEKTAKEVYADVFKMLANIFGKKPERTLVNEFKNKLVKKGKIEQRFLKSIDEISSVEKKVKSGKLSLKDVDNMKRDAIELIRALVEYAQRADIIETERGTMMQIIYSGNRKAELVLTGKDCFLIEGKIIRKIHGDKLELMPSSKEELEKALAESKGKLSTKISGEVFHTLEKALGKFEIVF